MTKTKLIFIGLALALVGFLFAGSASAQDGPPSPLSRPPLKRLESTPFTVTGTG